ncbi:MAG: glycosyltransferase family 4 protein [Porticoccaceae bacterium]|nr:glycosyltransferase family 4 protein [Porticoccaceae bacterium]
MQHEYGIFGGPAGSHILKLLAELRTPVVTTLHTVLTEPNEEYRKVMLRLAELSDYLVVMSHKAINILQSVYAIDPSKIRHIPHGIPDIPFVDPCYYKEQFGVLDKRVLLTFGLLSENKGIEYALQALPKVVEKFPDITYIVLGATHPHVLRTEGENYRLRLQQLVRKLKLEQHVIFQNRFVTLNELCDYLAATDIYITPYISEAQITSGTLAYAMGTGKPIVSTPYWYAEEMLADDRGVLVPFRDPDQLADALLRLLENDVERHSMRKKAYDHCRGAIWKSVAREYLSVFAEARASRTRNPRPYRPSSHLQKPSPFNLDLPDLKLNHLEVLTDDTGILQHARYAVPDRMHGYCTDDNARALIVAAEVSQLSDEPQQYNRLSSCYLSFLSHAFNPESGRFRNFMSYDRRWLEDTGSADAHGRALHALGAAVALLNQERQAPLASILFKQALPATESFTSLRSIAFSLLGVHAYLKSFSGDLEARRIHTLLADRLLEQFQRNQSRDWPWPENIVTYANPCLPHALIISGHWLRRDDMVEVGLGSLRWLAEIQTDGGHFVPIGCNGWYPRNGAKARFDQQPLEAQTMVEACVIAYQITEDQYWLQQAMMCFYWFLGQNDINLPLYDAKTGGCCDGLQSDGVNQNQGAESTLAWLLSLIRLLRLSANTLPDNSEQLTRVAAEGS